MANEHGKNTALDAYALTEDIKQIAAEINQLTSRAYVQYSSLVNGVLNDQITDVESIERIMDGLVDFSNDPRFLEIYKDLCRHIYYRYPQLVGEHVALFRLQFEENDVSDATGV